MSVTITIQNNIKYVDANCPEKIKTTTYECMCRQFEDDPFDSECPYCKGTGADKFKDYPFEMNISNSNFSAFWSSLGLDVDWCGEVNPNRVLEVLRTYDPELAERAQLTEKGDKGALYVDCGLTSVRSGTYAERLLEIADEAVLREEMIVWH